MLRHKTFLPVLLAFTAFATTLAAAEPPDSPPAPEDPCVPVSRDKLVWKDGNSWMKTHKDYVERVKQYPPGIVFFGDSITQWWPWQDFKARYETHGGADFGIGGDGTQHLLWRILNGELATPKVAVVMIGTNNLNSSPDIIAAAITKIVLTIREKSPATKVLLLGIFPRGWDEKGYPFYREKTRIINANIARLDDGRMIRYLDLESTLLEPDLTYSKDVSADSLHLKPEGYRRWAVAMQPLLEEMVGKPLPMPPPPVQTPKPEGKQPPVAE